MSSMVVLPVIISVVMDAGPDYRQNLKKLFLAPKPQKKEIVPKKKNFFKSLT